MRPVLSEEEREIMRLLLFEGYFELPAKKINLDEAAEKLGMHKSTLSLKLRSITAKVFAEYLKKAVGSSVY